jgi:hypothetical protein
MIRIKHQHLLVESDIPVPPRIIEFFMKQIKIHILQFLMSSLKIYILDLQKDVSKEEDEDTKESINKSINRYESCMKVLEQQYPKGILKREVEQIDNLELEIMAKDFIDSNYKYKLLNDRSNLNLTVFLTSNSREKPLGQYIPQYRSIFIYSGIWQSFTNRNSVYWFFTMRSSSDLNEKLNKLWVEYQSVLHHEVTHWVQDIFIPQGQWSKNAYNSNIESEEDFKKYISSNVEFFPHLKAEYELFWQDFERLNNGTFKQYISRSIFFNSLKRHNPDKWEKAVKQFYMLLQNKVS